MFEVRYINKKACVRVIRRCKNFKEINDAFKYYGIEEIPKRTRVQNGEDYRIVIKVV